MRTLRSGAGAGVVLLEAKLRPPPQRGGVVPRAALLERIRSRHRTHAIALVEAGAGYGKTTLAAELAGSDTRAVGWYSADELDNDPIVFLTYFATLLQRCGAPVGDVRRISVAGIDVGVAGAALCTAVTALPAPALIVVDDVHLVTSAACLRFLGALAQALPPESQIVLLSRRDPRIPLHDQGRVVHLGADDLRLTAVEAHALLRATGLELDPDDARILAARCDGWAAGLYLVAKAGRGAVDRLLADERFGVDRFIDDYFRSELLNGLDEETYEFLRDVAVLEQVSGPLCDAILDRTDSAERLAELADSNLFVRPLDDVGEWYRLQSLLRELLRTEIRRTQPERAASLLALATDWYVAAGDLDSATECALAGGDRERVADLVAEAALPAFWTGREATVQRWLAEVDDPLLLVTHPALAVIGACLLAMSSRPEAAARWATLAAEADPDLPMPDGSPASAWIAVLRAFLCLDGAAQMLSDAQAARATLTATSALRTSAEVCEGFALMLVGATADAERAFINAADSGIRSGANVGSAVALAMLSLQSSQRGDARAAESFVRRARDIVEEARLEQYMSTSVVYAAEARAALLRNRHTAMRTALDRATPLADSTTYALPWLAAYVRIELAHLYLALGDAGRARELLADAEEVVLRRPRLGEVEEWIASLRRDLRVGRSSDDGWVSPLTPAELRLLPLLTSYLSFREIAERLGISRNTVKTQAISVYRKLDVSSRTEAVERAQALGLLDRSSPQAGEARPAD
jgi:LuxR family transcriptional regulator, maltose regulon positive regulatory protein